MPRYYPKKSSQTESLHVLQTQKNSYLLTIRESEWSTLLYIGGTNYYCLECQIFKDNPLANLAKIEYNASCSLTGKFERGHDVFVILSLVMTYIKENYKHITTLLFDDYSYRNCSSSLEIDLAPFHYAIDGKTWYMSKLNAYFIEKSEELEFLAKDTQFQASKSTTSWEKYDSLVTTPHPLPIDNMITIYSESETWKDFFSRIRQTMPIETLCTYMAPWITNFIKNQAKINFTSYKFAIDVPNPKLQPVEYTILPYSVGGKHTRKNIRKRRGRDLH